MHQCTQCTNMVFYYEICMDCVRARANAVYKRRCVCGKKKRPTEVKRAYSRSWISCNRCLATIKQLS